MTRPAPALSITSTAAITAGDAATSFAIPTRPTPFPSTRTAITTRAARSLVPADTVLPSSSLGRAKTIVVLAARMAQPWTRRRLAGRPTRAFLRAQSPQAAPAEARTWARHGVPPRRQLACRGTGTGARSSDHFSLQTHVYASQRLSECQSLLCSVGIDSTHLLLFSVATEAASNINGNGIPRNDDYVSTTQRNEL